MQTSLSPAHLQLVVPDDSLTESISLAWTVQPNLSCAPTIGEIGDDTEGHVIGPLPAATGHISPAW